MYGEGFFHAGTVGNTSYGKGFGYSAAVLRDYSALEELNSLARTLFDLVINLNGITDVYNGYIFLLLLVCQSLDKIHSGFLLE